MSKVKSIPVIFVILQLMSKVACEGIFEYPMKKELQRTLHVPIVILSRTPEPDLKIISMDITPKIFFTNVNSVILKHIIANL